MMGELKYFLGFQIKQLQDGTFISQTKYIQDICWGLALKYYELRTRQHKERLMVNALRP
jgi:hypothetical protein